MPFDGRFLPDFLEAVLEEAVRLVEALGLEAFLVVTRLLPFCPARFLFGAALFFLLAAFLVLFFAPREGVVFFEADRPLLDFLAADPLPAFFVAILSSVNALAVTVRLLYRKDRAVRDSNSVGADFRGSETADESAAFATRQRPSILKKRCLLWTTL